MKDKIWDKKVWSKIAKEYINKRYYGKGLFKNERKVLLSLIPKNSSVLDIGCGTGRHVRFFKTHKINAVGLDSSIEMIKLARSLTRDQYIIGDAHHLPFKDGSFDFATCLGNTIGSLKFKKSIREMLRVSRVGIIIEFREGDGIEKRYIGGKSYYVRTWEKDEVKKLLKNLKINFKMIEGEKLQSTSFFYAVVRHNT